MKNRKTLAAVMLAVHCIPWAFLAMFGDSERNTMLVYVASFLILAGLGWCCRKLNCISWTLYGNLVSCLIYCLLSNQLWSAEANYFKPFGVTGFVLVLSAIMLMMQFLIWNVKKNAPLLCLC